MYTEPRLKTPRRSQRRSPGAHWYTPGYRFSTGGRACAAIRIRRIGRLRQAEAEGMAQHVRVQGRELALRLGLFRVVPLTNLMRKVIDRVPGQPLVASAFQTVGSMGCFVRLLGH